MSLLLDDNSGGGGFDSALRTGNAIGTIIEIAARLKRENRSEDLDGSLGLHDAKGKYTRTEYDDESVFETFTGTASHISGLRSHGYDLDRTFTKETLKDKDTGMTVVRERFVGKSSTYNEENWREYFKARSEQSLLESDLDLKGVERVRSKLEALENGTLEKQGKPPVFNGAPR